MMVQKPKVINEKSHFGMLFQKICTMKIGNSANINIYSGVRRIFLVDAKLILS